MSDVVMRQLEEIATIVTGSTPSSSDPDSWGDDVDFITPSDQIDGSRDAQPSRRLSTLGARRLSARIVPPLTTNLTCIGSTIGKVSMSKSIAVTNQQINSIVSIAGISDARYLYYMIKNWSPALKLHASGSATPIINKTVLSRYEFLIPSMSEQRAIAEVLGALDDKIAANTKLSSIIEQLLAMEVDVEWLNNLQEADLISILEMFEVNPSTPKPTEAVPLYLEMKKLPETGSGVSEWDYRPAKGGTRFKQGDALMARITPCLENRKTGFVDFLESGQVGIGSTEFVALRAREGIPKELSYFLAINTEFRDFAIRHMVGTSGRQRVSGSDVATYLVPTPNSVWLQDFAGRVESQFKFTKSLRDENRTLAATRDTLLPQLMSGKLRVRDAETAMEAVV